LWKNPQNLSENQQIKLAWIAATDPRLYRAYLLKEGDQPSQPANDPRISQESHINGS